MRIRPFVTHLCAQAAAHFGDELQAAYAIGSLAHGGYSAECSDIDVALFFATAGPRDLEPLRQRLRAFAPALEARLSIFWSTPGFIGGRFPPLDQVDLIDHGALVYGTAVRDLPRPSRAALEAQLRDHATGYWASLTREFSGDRPADKELARCLIYPARLLFTWATGQMTSNDDAVRWLNDHPAPGLDLAPINHALAVRLAQQPLAALDAYRPVLHPQYAASMQQIG